MEDNPREMELNFDGGNDVQIEELEAVRDELSCVVNSDTDGASDIVENNPVNEETTASDPAVDESNRKADLPTFTPDTEVLLRSRHPVNRPGGTPPLSTAPSWTGRWPPNP